MGFLILIAIFLLTWGLIKALSSASSEPTTTTPQQNRTTESKRYYVEHRGLPRMQFLKKYEWENTPRKYFISYKPFSLELLPGYSSFPFIGTQYREDVTIEDIGWFNGFAFCELTNPHDKHAIAIYREDGKKLGYIPRGELDLFYNIFEQGCMTHVYGALSFNPETDKWLGIVAVLTNKDVLEGGVYRFDNPNITFYETTDNLIDYIKETQREANESK